MAEDFNAMTPANFEFAGALLSKKCIFFQHNFLHNLIFRHTHEKVNSRNNRNT